MLKHTKLESPNVCDIERYQMGRQVYTDTSISQLFQTYIYKVGCRDKKHIDSVKVTKEKQHLPPSRSVKNTALYHYCSSNSYFMPHIHQLQSCLISKVTDSIHDCSLRVVLWWHFEASSMCFSSGLPWPPAL